MGHLSFREKLKRRVFVQVGGPVRLADHFGSIARIEGKLLLVGRRLRRGDDPGRKRAGSLRAFRLCPYRKNSPTTIRPLVVVRDGNC